MRKYVLSFIGAAFVILGISGPAQSVEGWTDYKPGVVKSALANGKTTLIFYKSTWWGTCARQSRVLNKLRESEPKYNQSITFILVDWDTYKKHEVTTSRKIPRRSTLVLIKNGEEMKRLVAQTSEEKIKTFLDIGITN